MAKKPWVPHGVWVKIEKKDGSSYRFAMELAAEACALHCASAMHKKLVAAAQS